MYLFDPTQFPELGHHFYEGDGFSYRYQMSKKLFFKSIYIPLGPNCDSKQGFDNFLNHIKSLKFTKTKIDLPTIYENKKSIEVVKKVKAAGFKQAKYIQDEETLLVIQDDLHLPHSEMNQVRNGLKKANIIIKNELSDEELKQIYKVYLIAAKRLEITPKDIAIFKKLSEKCQAVLAYNIETKNLDGFLLNYLVETDLSDVTGNQGDNKLLLSMYTGLTDEGRNCQIGRAIYYESYTSAFEKMGVNVIDFHGASRSKGRSYMGFKLSFSKRFLSLPGSFEKIRLI